MITPGVSSGERIRAYRNGLARLVTVLRNSAVAIPMGTATTSTPAATIRLLRSACHMPRSAASSPNQRSVVPSHGVTVGKRLSLKVAAAMMISGRNR